MNRLPFELPTSYRSSQGQSLLFGQVVVIIMMVTIGVGVAQLGPRLSPGWHGGYLAWVSLIVAIEAILTRKRVKELELREKLFFRFSEWIAFAVALKLLIYLIRGPAQLLVDLPLWQEDFVNNFFTGEYLLALAITALVWLCSGSYAGELEDLYDREQDAVWDELGKLQNALHDIRNKIAARIFVLGALVVILAAFSRIDATKILRSIGKPPPGYNTPIINVLVYFILALLLLSQTQFALLRTRWLWQRLSISPRLAKNWLIYGLLFFLILSIVVFFLPTNYSIGLFDTLRIALGYLVQLVSFLMILITFPLTLCLSLFRFSTGTPEATPTPGANPVFPPTATQPQPIPWLEFVKSLAFWIVFLAVIFFAVRYYLTQNTALWNAIVSFPLFRWISAAWRGLWKWLKGANHQIAELVQSGIRRLRPPRAASPARAIRRIFNLARMSPREKIIYFYLNLIELGGERGLERRPSQTPYQYEQRVSSTIPEVDPDLHALTETFLEARYSPHPVDEPKSQQASSLWERVKAILRSWKRPEE